MRRLGGKGGTEELGVDSLGGGGQFRIFGLKCRIYFVDFLGKQRFDELWFVECYF